MRFSAEESWLRAGFGAIHLFEDSGTAVGLARSRNGGRMKTKKQTSSSKPEKKETTRARETRGDRAGLRRLDAVKPKPKTTPRTKSPPRDSILVSLTEDPDYLEEVGSRVVAARLVTAARDRLTYAEEDEKVLAKFGFDAEWRSELTTEVDKLESLAADRVGAGTGAAETATDLAATLEKAEEWLKTYGAVVKNSGPTVRAKAPRVPQHLEQSPVLVAPEITVLATFIRKNAVQTARHGGGITFADEGKRIVASLTTRRASHKKARKGVPTAARTLHSTAGVVYLELVRLTRIAHAKLSGGRAKDYVVRSRRGHRRGQEEGPSSPPPGTPKAS
jgi:hypothetical protein